MSIFGFEVIVPVLVLGAVTGMTYGILAVGLVLIYRSHRIINFAHGEIGAFGAALLGLSVARWNFPYWVAFPLALLASAGIGSLAEVAVVRRLRKAPNVMSIVATLGVAQFLLLFSFVINSQVAAGRIFPQPSFLPEFDVGALRVNRAYFGMLVLTPLLVAGLVLFLRRTRYGLAIRGSAANADAARMAGVFASRMSTLSWAIAGAVSAFTAILVFPTRGFVTSESLGPGLLLRALVGAVVARMQNLPVALATGIFVGVVEQELLWNYPRGGFVEMVLFGVILLVLLLQKRGGGREEEKGSWAAVQAWAPLPDAFLWIRSIRNLGWILGAVALAFALVLPALITNRHSIILVAIMGFALVGLSLGIVTGLGGQLSLGQFALAGIGAIASYAITARTGNYLLGLLCAGLAAAGVSVLIGLPALRIRGLMLAVTTLSFALAAQAWLFQQSWMLGDGVDPGRPVLGSLVFDTGKKYYFFTLFFLIIGLIIARNVWRSGLARRLIALRDNEDGARAFTVPITIVKLQGFALAGFLAGLGGAVYGHALSRISSQSFPVVGSVNLVAMTVLGGVGTLAGPLVGALYIIGIPAFLPLDSAGLAATSLGWLVLILYFPGGIAQLARPIRDRLVDWLARRKGLDPAAIRAGADAAMVAAEALGGDREPPPRGVAGPSAGALLEVRDLSRSFGGLRAVDRVSLQVAPQETLGLIGPNGAGKTTLFELLGGFIRLHEGRVTFAGRDVTRMTPEQRGKLGLIRSFQDASLFPTMTVLDTVKLALERSAPTRFFPSALGLPRAERKKDERARRLVTMMGLDPWRKKQISELSTGTRRIAEIACLMALEPTLLLLDEPSSGIAQRETEALGRLLGRVKERLDTTMVIIEHDMPLIMGLSDRIVAMESGRIIADGPPEEIRSNPLVIESYLGGDISAIGRSDVVAAAKIIVPDGRCQGVTRSGARCTRRAVADGFCAQHRTQAPVG